MQDGATSHTANSVLDFLHETFGNRVMSHRYPQRHHEGLFWPPLGPELTPTWLFLWGYLKEKLYLLKPQNLMEMRARIVQLCNEINEDLCRKFDRNISTDLREIVRCNGGHIELVCKIWKYLISEIKMLWQDWMYQLFVRHSVYLSKQNQYIQWFIMNISRLRSLQNVQFYHYYDFY